MKKVVLFLILPLLSACGLVTTAPSLSPSVWLNAPVEQLISAWGEPDSIVPLDNGGRCYTWTRRSVSTEIGSTYLGSDGKVKKHPDVVTSKLLIIKATVNAEGLIKDFQVSPAR